MNGDIEKVTGVLCIIIFYALGSFWAWTSEKIIKLNARLDEIEKRLEDMK